MKINYLLDGDWGHTGGSLVLYNFMDNLSARGHRVNAILPTERVAWRPGFSQVVIGRVAPGLGSSVPGRGYARSTARLIMPRASGVRRFARGLLRRRATRQDVLDRLRWMTRGLEQNWQAADVSISTFCLTCYANLLFMDETAPLYHMQSYEELFFEDELAQKLARLTYYMPFTFMANSLWLQEQIKRRMGRETVLLNPGIDTTVFYPRSNPELKYREPRRIRVVSLYSPLRLKAWRDALAAMKMAFRKLGEDRLEWVIFGGVPTGQLDVPARFVGRVFGDALAELYSSAHIVFTSSWYESFHLTPLEGMACGAAVVVTRLGTEDFAFDGENAVIVPARNPERLAEALVDLAQNPSRARHLAENGIETARRFTWDAATSHLEAILERSVASRGNEFADVRQLIFG